MFRKQIGLTLIETMITTTIASVVLSLAVPSWKDAVAKRNVTAGAEDVAAFLSHAQSYSMKSNQEVTVTFTRDPDGKTWCMGAIDETAKLANSLDHCECDTINQCTLDGQESVIDEGGFDSLVIHQSRVLDNPLVDFHFNFDPIRGLVTTDMGSVDSNRYSVVIQSEGSGHKLRVSTLPTGRNKICNPTGNGKIPAYKTCSS